jgi:hypothetical protein
MDSHVRPPSNAGAPCKRVGFTRRVRGRRRSYPPMWPMSAGGRAKAIRAPQPGRAGTIEARSQLLAILHGTCSCPLPQHLFLPSSTALDRYLSKRRLLTGEIPRVHGRRTRCLSKLSWFVDQIKQKGGSEHAIRPAQHGPGVGARTCVGEPVGGRRGPYYPGRQRNTAANGKNAPRNTAHLLGKAAWRTRRAGYGARGRNRGHGRGPGAFPCAAGKRRGDTL